MSLYENEISKRRTFAIISHPDAGKTTLTEKFLLYGGAINQAGSVKGRKTAKHAVSDWMEIEKQRGISVTSSVLQFHYEGYCINILDTPGHQDFSEDTYRTLMAADSAVMVIDASKGVEAQTIKLFKVCVMRHIPIFTFINKLDREANDPFDLMDEIERVLGIKTCPINWPIGCGSTAPPPRATAKPTSASPPTSARSSASKRSRAITHQFVREQHLKCMQSALPLASAGGSKGVRWPSSRYPKKNKTSDHKPFRTLFGMLKGKRASKPIMDSFLKSRTIARLI